MFELITVVAFFVCLIGAACKIFAKQKAGKWAIATILLLVIMIVNPGNDTVTSSNTPSANKPTISKEEFDQLKSGMSYEEATAIIGGPGVVISESGNPGDQLHTVMYQYEGEGDLGANANLLFQGNKLQNKAQFGLK
ncbi:DUF3862 domain-containing protein [Desulforamulus hydrothermalis]|uniref:DUF3862 domain-containing protein n=1 Tax=Desulforamulus hydrothermalis TaxID=412895 RepID=UPI000912E768|nr:DUF3862 domain-containing protein [Desulforamulus hydrothermalis]SHH37497.1 protein of unknown function [Desulforamulus hydrothermalis Lam5 = DSM 18033]